MKIESALVGFAVIAMMAAPLSLVSIAAAQTAADHEALAHGEPIVNGHPVRDWGFWNFLYLAMSSEAWARSFPVRPSPTKTSTGGSRRSAAPSLGRRW